MISKHYSTLCALLCGASISVQAEKLSGDGVHWGDEIHGLKPGVTVETVQGKIGFSAITRRSSSNFFMYYFPPHGFPRFRIEITDPRGEIIQERATAKNLYSSELPKERSPFSLGATVFSINPESLVDHGWYNLSDHFVFNRTGDHIMSIQFYLYQRDATLPTLSRSLVAFATPSITVSFKVPAEYLVPQESSENGGTNDSEQHQALPLVKGAWHILLLFGAAVFVLAAVLWHWRSGKPPSSGPSP